MLRAGAAAGGTPSIGLAIQGEWSAATAYTANQIVTYNGSSYYAVAASTAVVPGTDGASWGILALGGTNGSDGTSGASYGASLLTGGGVVWNSAYAYTVSAATYAINGTVYSSAETIVTLTAADGANPRIDVIALTSSSTAIKIDGTAAANPAEASIDPLTQIKVAIVYVAAGSAAATIATTSIYAENIEWTSSVSGGTISAASTSNPRAGTKDIEATSAIATNYVNLSNGSAFDTTTRTTLSFYIRSKAAWPSAKSIQIQWNLAGVAKGTPVTIKTGAYGFNSGTTGAYQLVVIPLSAFGVAGISVDALRFTVTGGSSAIGFYIDDVAMQGGVTQVTPTASMAWRGAYSASVQYLLNDVVSYLGQIAIATGPVLGTAPGGTGWTLLSIGTTVLTAAPSNQSYSGETISMTYGESIVPGDILYLKSDGAVWKADANAATLYPAIGLALETASSGSHLVLLRGIYRDDSRYAFTVGGVVYLSTTAGGETQTAPAATDDVTQVLGVATHADRIYFNPSLNYITHV